MVPLDLQTKYINLKFSLLVFAWTSKDLKTNQRRPNKSELANFTKNKTLNFIPLCKCEFCHILCICPPWVYVLEDFYKYVRACLCTLHVNIVLASLSGFPKFLCHRHSPSASEAFKSNTSTGVKISPGEIAGWWKTSIINPPLDLPNPPPKSIILKFRCKNHQKPMDLEQVPPIEDLLP